MNSSQQSNSQVQVTASGTDPVEVGQVRNVPVDLSHAKHPIDVTCVILEHRWSYGRNEYLVAPVNGEGAAWVREDRIVPPPPDDDEEGE